MQKSFSNYREFYPYYLTQHQHPVCRALHVVGLLVSLTLAITLIISGHALWLPIIPFVGYTFSWTGHFVFEKNKPATLGYPLYSLIGDFQMVADTLAFKRTK